MPSASGSEARAPSRDRPCSGGTRTGGMAARDAALLEVQRVDHRRVLVREQVDHEVPAALERVHMVEAEEGVRLVGAAQLTGLTVDHLEAGALLGMPAVVLDERAAGEREPERIHAERVFGQDHVALAHAEGVHVGRLIHRQAADQAPLLRAGREPPDAVLVLASDLGAVVHELIARRVVVRMGGRHLPPFLSPRSNGPTVASVSGRTRSAAGSPSSRCSARRSAPGSRSRCR